MSIERCSECEKQVDTDRRDFFYIDGRGMCDHCMDNFYNKPFKKTARVTQLISPSSSWDDPLPDDYESKGFQSIDINADTCRTCGNRACSCQQLADERLRNRGIEG